MRHSTARKYSNVMLGVLACVALAPIAAQRMGSPRGQFALASALPGRFAEMRHNVRFEGVGAEGIDNIWRGAVGGADPGEITLRIEYRGAPMDVSQPRWPVRAMTFVAANDPAHSFLAESEGTLDWSTGKLELNGSVTEGSMKGAAVAQTVHFDRNQLDGSGSIRIDLVTASR
jgi:hypothetical protein